MKLRDLGLSYEEAAHGLQSAIRFEMSKRGIPDDDAAALIRYVKQMRVGIDMRASDAQGLATLLIEKGVFTVEEYAEHVRIAANEELARYIDAVRREHGLPDGMDFR